MEQLTMGEILKLAVALQNNGMTAEEIANLPVYIGNDDELNGIHCAWCTGIVDADKNDENTILVEMINERHGNYKLEKGKAILIS